MPVASNDALRAEVNALRQAVERLTTVAEQQAVLMTKQIQQAERHDALSARVDKIEEKQDDVIFPSMGECERTAASMKTWVRALSLFVMLAHGIVIYLADAASDALKKLNDNETRITVLEAQNDNNR